MPIFNFSLEMKNVQEHSLELKRVFRERAYIATEILWEQLYKEVEINLSDNILHIRTGRLISSLPDNSYIDTTANAIKAQVGVTTHYAQYHEFGFRGTVNFGSYSREVNYGGRPYVRPALNRIALNVGAVLATEVNK